MPVSPASQHAFLPFYRQKLQQAKNRAKLRKFLAENLNSEEAKSEVSELSISANSCRKMSECDNCFNVIITTITKKNKARSRVKQEEN